MRIFGPTWAISLSILTPLLAAIPPAQWVPARWNWSDPKTLDLLSGTPINCLLIKTYAPAFVEQAHERGIILLADVTPGGDPAQSARKAVEAKLDGVVLEGGFSDDTVAQIKDLLVTSKVIVIELTARNRMKLGGPDPIIGTYQGVWPGIQIMKNGAARAAPSGNPWIDTNTGFIRAVRAWGHATLWLGNLPPPHTVITGQRYLQVICDAAMAGARWIVALDDNFAGRLQQGEPTAMRDWRRMALHLKYFEDHPEWRLLDSYGKLAIVQDPQDGALLSGGILDMISAKHTPVRAIPRELLSLNSLEGATMAVDVDPQTLTEQQRETLKAFARSGGTVLTAPPGWKDTGGAKSNQITLDNEEIKRLNDIWHDVQTMVGRNNLGARLFNVSSMLSNLRAGKDGKEVYVTLVNYSGYPVESVTVQFLGQFHHARLYTPEGGEKELEVYKTEDGTGVDIDKVSVCVTLRVD